MSENLCIGGDPPQRADLYAAGFRDGFRAGTRITENRGEWLFPVGLLSGGGLAHLFIWATSFHPTLFSTGMFFVAAFLMYLWGRRG